jgi:nucleoside 2-deoxyribosyltransferase
MFLNKCPLCEDQNVVTMYNKGTSEYVNCNNCGIFIISNPALLEIWNYDKSDLMKISAIVRQYNLYSLKPPIMIYSSAASESDVKESENPTLRIKDAIEQFPRKVTDRFDKALLNLSRMSPGIGAKFTIQQKDFPVFYIDNPEEKIQQMLYIMEHLIKEGYVEGSPTIPSEIRITPKGWGRIYDLEQTKNPSSKTGFIAMWFDESMNNASEAIKRAIRNAGYDPLRIDDLQHNHNGKIDDRIIAEIRRSKFVVADFTGNRGGVYFEAGFAMGLGIPVIWMVRSDRVNEDLHFDTRQYNHIVWKDEDDLYNQLYNRIRATIV